MKRHSLFIQLGFILLMSSACSRQPEKVSQLQTGQTISGPAKVETAPP